MHRKKAFGGKEISIQESEWNFAFIINVSEAMNSTDAKLTNFLSCLTRLQAKRSLHAIL